VLAGIASSLVARRLGAPLLLVFLLVGMLAGEDGPGGIRFDDYRATYLIGSIALAVILFDGGLRTRLSALKGALAPSLALSTVGVVLTAAVTGVFASWVLGLSLLQGLLLGSIVASTDAAAVFFLLHAGNLRLSPRVNTVLEIESGTNDPVAVFMTVVLTEMLVAGGSLGAWPVAGAILGQLAFGALFGVAGGLAVAFLLNRVDLPSGLHPVFVIACALFIFALTAVVGGSGFLAVYLAGLVLGNRPTRAIASVVSFHDAATWLCQIVMFLVLGLLATPSDVLDFAGPGIAMALVLMLIARPVAVAAVLAPFGFSVREIGFIAWVGLRGAVSIFLAAVPMLSGLPAATAYFNTAFFVVLVSLVAQGWTLRPAARRLGLALPAMAQPARRIELDLPGQLERELVGYPVQPHSLPLTHGALPSWARLVLVVRGGEIMDPWEAGGLREGDFAYLIAPPDRAYRLDRLFAPGAVTAGADRLGLFHLRGDAPLGPLAELYGLELPSDARGRTLADLFASRFDEQPQPGDRITLGPAVLVAEKVHEQRVVTAGLLLDDLAGSLIDDALARGGHFKELRARIAAWRPRLLAPGRASADRQPPEQSQAGAQAEYGQEAQVETEQPDRGDEAEDQSRRVEGRKVRVRQVQRAEAKVEDPTKEDV
jgi:cell volume regulation protein A